MKNSVSFVMRNCRCGRMVAAALALALLVGTGDAAAEGSGRAACSLLTAPDLQGVLGTAFTPLAEHFPRESCAYSRGGRGMVTITVTTPGGSAEETLRGRRGMFKGRITPAPELGPAAFIVTGARSMSVHFGKGAWVAQLDASADATGDRQQLVRLAKKILARG